jgi:hypothetical protein
VEAVARESVKTAGAIDGLGEPDGGLVQAKATDERGHKVVDLEEAANRGRVGLVTLVPPVGD